MAGQRREDRFGCTPPRWQLAPSQKRKGQSRTPKDCGQWQLLLPKMPKWNRKSRKTGEPIKHGRI